MSGEKIIVKLLIDKTKINEEEIVLHEEAPDDEEMVLLQLTRNGKQYKYKEENIFYALQSLRKDLEKEKIQILCNGAAENVHPSSMQLSMGIGRKAYKLYIAEQAKLIDVVDIFDYDESLNFVDIDKQSKFYDSWIRSINKRD